MKCVLCDHSGPVAEYEDEAIFKPQTVAKVHGVHPFYVHLGCAQALSLASSGHLELAERTE